MQNLQKYGTTIWKYYKYLKARRVIISSAMLLMLVTAPVDAGTIQIFSINFAGDRTGSGSFSVDVGGSICAETIYDGCNPSMPWYPTTIFYNPVTAFSVDIAEQHYGSMYPAWWLAGSQQPGSATPSRYQPYYTVAYNRWFTGDPYLGTRQFLIYFSAVNATGGNGTWTESVIPAYDPAGVGYYASGTWTATVASAPVPAAVWLLGSGLLALLGIARNRKTIWAT